MFKIISLIFCLVLTLNLAYAGTNQKNTTRTTTTALEQAAPTSKEAPIFLGKWIIKKIFYSGAPSPWDKKELEKYIGSELYLSKDQTLFNGIHLADPKFSQQVLTSQELTDELATTYNAIGLADQHPATLVTIYKGEPEDEDNTWITESLIYRFFVKDSDTLIAENRNVFFILERIKSAPIQ